MQLIVIGSSSKKRIIIPLLSADLKKNLLLFLQEKEIPIASSCTGRQICEKCCSENGDLICMFTVEEYLEKSTPLVVSYL